jgi:hypothetical protein
VLGSVGEVRKMSQPLRLEAEITADRQLHVDLPPDVPCGRVVLILVPAAEDPECEILEEDLLGSA